MRGAVVLIVQILIYAVQILNVVNGGKLGALFLLLDLLLQFLIVECSAAILQNLLLHLYHMLDVLWVHSRR